MRKKYDFTNLGLDPIKFGLVAKLTLVMLLASIIPLVLNWGFSLKMSLDRIERDNTALLAETANGLATQADEWLDKNVRVIKTAALLQDIRSMNRREQEDVLKAINQEYPWMYLVFTLDTRGMNIARNDGKPLKDYSDRSYYSEVMNGKELSWQTLIGKTSGKPAIVLAVPIKNNGNIVGVMAAAMNIDDISDRVANWKKGKSGYAYMVDEKGKVVAHPQEEFVMNETVLDRHPVVANFLAGKDSQIINFIDTNAKPTLGFIKKTAYGWGLILQQEKSEVFAAIQRVIIIAVILLVFTIIVILIVATIAARSVVNPLRELTYAANEMSMGNLNVNVKSKSKDEIGYLAFSIDRMQSSLTMAIKRLQSRKT
ncbi:MAG: HAMP domain-containing protein [Candidatus Cloacimonetes bacterium]|nr:HAMP domain-containing protein [Candidatus Cloacimonadota bacterium]